MPHPLSFKPALLRKANGKTLILSSPHPHYRRYQLLITLYGELGENLVLSLEAIPYHPIREAFSPLSAETLSWGLMDIDVVSELLQGFSPPEQPSRYSLSKGTTPVTLKEAEAISLIEAVLDKWTRVEEVVQERERRFSQQRALNLVCSRFVNPAAAALFDSVLLSNSVGSSVELYLYLKAVQGTSLNFMLLLSSRAEPRRLLPLGQTGIGYHLLEQALEGQTITDSDGFFTLSLFQLRHLLNRLDDYWEVVEQEFQALEELSLWVNPPNLQVFSYPSLCCLLGVAPQPVVERSHRLYIHLSPLESDCHLAEGFQTFFMGETRQPTNPSPLRQGLMQYPGLTTRLQEVLKEYTAVVGWLPTQELERVNLTPSALWKIVSYLTAEWPVIEDWLNLRLTNSLPPIEDLKRYSVLEEFKGTYHHFFVFHCPIGSLEVERIVLSSRPLPSSPNSFHDGLMTLPAIQELISFLNTQFRKDSYDGNFIERSLPSRAKEPLTVPRPFRERLIQLIKENLPRIEAELNDAR